MTHSLLSFFFFFNDTATTEIYTLSLHDALPIYLLLDVRLPAGHGPGLGGRGLAGARLPPGGHRRAHDAQRGRSEEHTSELQSRQYLVCRLLLEKKKTYTICHLLSLSLT